MEISGTHKLDLVRIDDEDLDHCTVCGALAPSLLAQPCKGRAPSLEVHDDGNVIAIQWSFPEGGVARSRFPQTLITIDETLDGRPIGVVFVGARARELRAALKGES